MSHNEKSLRLWLFSCAGLVFAMLVVGAITRLTGSGLSITEWKPVTGIIPPLNEKDWNLAFELYKRSPEFKKENFWMEMNDFQRIFFWEWLHRFLGRLTGLVYALPLLYFWIRKKIPAGSGWKFLSLLALGGLQGLMGWVMVQSGLIDRPDVSHFRLAAHLSLALLLFALLVWLGLSIGHGKKNPHRSLYAHGWVVLAFFAVTACWGAFTAGLDAGLIYNESFPKMGATWIPAEVSGLSSLFENPAGVQFVHRWLAILTVLMIWGFWLHALARHHAFPALHILALMGLLQAGLGIATLFSSLFLPLAVLHQAGAAAILLLLVISQHRLKPS